MFNDMFNIFESVMASLLATLKFHVNDYCDLETTEDNSFVAKDGSMGTMLRYGGFRSLIGVDEYKNFSRELARSLEQFMGSRGHMMQIVFVRDDDVDHKVTRMLEPSYDTCRGLGMDLEDLLDEKKAIAKHFCLDEEVYIILWTRPAILDPMEVKLSASEKQELITKYGVPNMVDAQNITRPIQFLADRHAAFVQQFENDVRRINGAIEVVEIHEAICELKRYLYKNTPYAWRPVLVGDSSMLRWKNNQKKRDVSEFMPYRLDDQIFSAPAHVGEKNGINGVTDTTAVRLGGRIFAPVHIKTPQQRKVPFTKLFHQLNNASSTNAEGQSRPMPWSVSFLIEGDGLRGITLRKIIAGVLGWTSSDNRNLRAAAQALSDYKVNENGAVVKLQISAVTWADYGEEKELVRRRNKLSTCLQSWGQCNVEEETGDPAEALMTCAPGMRLTSPSAVSAAPLDWLTYMLPLNRPSSTFHRGTTIFRSNDHKIMPWEMFSDQQLTWVVALFGGPGSGKSVFANRLNTEMCMLPGLVRLPFICVIDKGVSSSGFISLVKDSLPDNKKHLALYLRLQNTEKYCINQFDTQLGQRKPLAREREMMKNFLVSVATPPEKGKAHNYANEFAGFVIDEAFKRLSDEGDHAKPKEFNLHINATVEAAIKSTGITYSEASTWWDIVDALFERGMYYEASVAQRYAQPTLFDILNVVASPESAHFSTAMDEGVSVIQEFTLMINSAKSEYPIFNGETRYDIGESRVMSIDLNDVVTKGSAAARKKTSLMYMVALNAFLKKISLIAEDLPEIHHKYRSYHAKRAAELAEDHKRLFCDEYHHTGDNASLRENILIFGRESRKWLLEIVLASQLPDDFAEMADIATTIVILESGNENTRSRISEIFGLTPTEDSALKTWVHGPIKGQGSTFLAKIKTKTAELSQLYTATSGGLELWGLSTTAEDKALRSALYSRMPSIEARKVLKDRFPDGTCQTYVLDQKAKSQSSKGEGFIDDDQMKSMLEVLADQLFEKWKRDNQSRSVIE